MFHRFSATPGKICKESKALVKDTSTRGSGSTAKRQKTARACDRCRLHRIKCGDQRPCANCVGLRAKCIDSYGSPRAPLVGNNDTSHIADTSTATSSAIHSTSGSTLTAPVVLQAVHESGGSGNNAVASVTPNTFLASHSLPELDVTTQQEQLWTETDVANDRRKDTGTTTALRRRVSATQAAITPGFAPATCLSIQIPHPSLPFQCSSFSRRILSTSQRSFYLRLFKDIYHPLLQILSESELASLNTPTSDESPESDEVLAKSALLDSMIALGVQYSHATGLAGRILGLQRPDSLQPNFNESKTSDTWPGSEYFHRSRDRMRITADTSLDVLRCHTLLVLYLMKGNAFREAFNLLGITVRKAYIARLHRPPPSYLSGDEQTSRVQLWWLLFSLDLQCSLQLDMPTACQKSLVKCPLPSQNVLARCTSSSGDRSEGINASTYSVQRATLAAITANVSVHTTTADIVDGDGTEPAALDQIILSLSSGLKELTIWHDHLPPELLLTYRGNAFADKFQMFDFEFDMSTPSWMQRQIVLLELYYHHVCMLIQRPFILLNQVQQSEVSGMSNPSNTKLQLIEQYVTNALRHATMVISIASTVCSASDIFYGWSEILQTVWNATLTVIAYICGHASDPAVPQALETIERGLAILRSFSPTWSSAVDALALLRPLVDSLQSTIPDSLGTNTAGNLMDWDSFALLLGEQQTFLTGSGGTLLSNDVFDGMNFSPSIAYADTLDYLDTVVPPGTGS